MCVAEAASARCVPLRQRLLPLLLPCCTCSADIALSGRSRFFSALPPQVVANLQAKPYAMENHAHGETEASTRLRSAEGTDLHFKPARRSLQPLVLAGHLLPCSPTLCVAPSFACVQACRGRRWRRTLA